MSGTIEEEFERIDRIDAIETASDIAKLLAPYDENMRSWLVSLAETMCVRAFCYQAALKLESEEVGSLGG
jgi:hypothetical protein